MFDNPGIAEAMRAYVLETAPVLALYLDANYCVALANAQARQVLRAEAFGRPLAEQVVDFTRSLDLPALIRQDGAVHRLTLSTVSGMPETMCFRFPFARWDARARESRLPGTAETARRGAGSEP